MEIFFKIWIPFGILSEISSFYLDSLVWTELDNSSPDGWRVQFISILKTTLVSIKQFFNNNNNNNNKC